MKNPALVITLLAGFAANGIAAKLPRPATDLTIFLPGGKQAKVSDYRGKPLIVMLFLTTCPHCQFCAGILNGVQKDLGPKGLQILAGAINEGADVESFVKEFHVTFPVGTVNQLTAMSFMQLSPDVRTFLPYVLFIDRKGVIQSQFTGGDDFLKDEAKEEANIRAEALKWLDTSSAKDGTRGKKKH